MNPLTETIDVLIIAEWGLIMAYFVQRFLKHRRMVSLSLAGMASGWLILGLGERIIHIHEGAGLLKSIALVFGLLVWLSIWRVEAETKKR